jgi:hypothetical protein
LCWERGDAVSRRRTPLADPDGRALTVRSPEGEPSLLAVFRDGGGWQERLVAVREEDVDKLVREIRKWQRGRRPPPNPPCGG